MERQEIKNNLSIIAEHSREIFRASQDNSVLFDLIEGLSPEAKKELFNRYRNTSGPVLGIRKQVVDEFVVGPINRKETLSQFETGKISSPKKYSQYKNLFSVLYPFVTISFNNLVNNTLNALAKDLRTALSLEGVADIKCVDFDGGRNTGSEHVWFAIYNNSYPNQKTAKQLYFSIQNGVVDYALYDRAKDFFLEKHTCTVTAFEYSALFDFYERYKSMIILDNYRANMLSKYPLSDLINKLSSGAIKSWLIKPGIKGSMWKKALKEENIRIGWGKVIDEIYDQNNFNNDFILNKLDKYYKTGTQQTNNRHSIREFLVDVKPKDIVFAVSGTADIIGLGIITSETELDEQEDEYKAFHYVDWLIDISKKPYKPSHVLPIKTVTRLDSSISITIISSVFNFTPSLETQPMDLPFLNTILYGPPGTGKTFELNKYKNALFTDSGITKTPEEVLRERVSHYPFWKILGAVLGTSSTALTVSELIVHPIVKAKIKLTNKTKPNNLAWADLQSYADDESTAMVGKYRRSIKLFHKEEGSKWTISEDKKDELSNIIEQDLLDLAINPVVSFEGSKSSNQRYKFITFHQKYSYEDFIEGIKPLLKQQDAEDETENTGSLQFELRRGIFYNSCLGALKLVGYESFEECLNDSREGRFARFSEAKHVSSKQFALFIDEINRANISAVFGELITLLEEDKRIGADNEMWVELPYSNEKFCVPANLYVIGTMNTADRSIALLDIALRRRFEFEAIYPLYTETEWWAVFLEKLNEGIYKLRKNPDYFIGHAFFINKAEAERTTILNTKIIPLLYEYCQNNTETVKRILTEAEVKLKPTSIKENYQIIAL